MQSQNKRTFQNLSIVGDYPGKAHREEQFQGSCFFMLSWNWDDQRLLSVTTDLPKTLATPLFLSGN